MQLITSKNTNRSLSNNFTGNDSLDPANTAFLVDYLTKKFIKKLNLNCKKSKHAISEEVKKIFAFYIEYNTHEVILFLYKKFNHIYNVEFITLPNFYKNDEKIRNIEKILNDTYTKKVAIVSLKEFYLDTYKNILF